jgi:hypothetical protein
LSAIATSSPVTGAARTIFARSVEQAHRRQARVRFSPLQGDGAEELSR